MPHASSTAAVCSSSEQPAPFVDAQAGAAHLLISHKALGLASVHDQAIEVVWSRLGALLR
jgi:hypothetical protein